MSERYPLHALLLWAALLASSLALFCLPLSTVGRLALALSVVAVALIALYWLNTQQKRWAATTPTPLAGLASHAQLPVILVVGSQAARLFPRSAGHGSIRLNSNGIWLHVGSPALFTEAVRMVERAQGRLPFAVLLPVLPDECLDAATVTSELMQWRCTFAEFTRVSGRSLPCYLATYAHLGWSNLNDSTDVVWFGDVLTDSTVLTDSNALNDRLQAIRHRLEQCPTATKRNALGQALLDWLNETILPTLDAPAPGAPPLALQGLLIADIGTPDHRPPAIGAWPHWLNEKSGLLPTLAASASCSLPIPSFLIPLLPTRTGGLPLWRGACHAVCLAMIALCTAFAASAWSNQRLVERVTSDLATYRQTPNDPIHTKRAALHTLEQDRTELRHYLQLGTPFHLGWGLYRGVILLPVIDQAITSYRPSAPLPTTVTLDSLSLFDSGKTTLKPDVERELVKALFLIQSNRNKRVLIAGHTDRSGTASANLKLSDARARAVRDWFVAMSDLPETQFVIQGYGDSRPIASNADAAGRARNRRVEITLVPDTPAR